MERITVFEKFNRVTEHMPFSTMMEQIKSKKYELQIVNARMLLAAGNQADFDLAKRNLRAFTPSADFTNGRNKECFTEYSGIIALDIDKVGAEAVAALKIKAAESPYTYAAFISPSGRGLKLFARVDSGPDDHKRAFNLLRDFYQRLLGVEIDPSGKDISRLCFVSYDPDLYFNEVAMSFEVPDAVFKPLEPLPLPLSPRNDAELAFADCIRQTSKTHAFVEGQRNIFVFLTALRMNRRGIGKDETLDLLHREHYCFDENEVRRTVDSAYNYQVDVGSPAATFLEASSPVTGTKKKKPKRGGDNTVSMDAVESFLNKRIDRRFNVVTNRLEIRDYNTDDDFMDISDYEENSLYIDLKHAGLKIPMALLHSLLNSDFSPRYNPFLTYFDGLKTWDRSTDYIALLAGTVHTRDQTFWELCLRKWITAMVASLLDDRVVNHTVIVFTGPQGIGKTTWLQHLVPVGLGKYQFSGTINPSNKDTLIQLSECIVINLDELETLSRTEQGSLKELITMSELRFRRPYGYYTDNLPRRASFVGSVNTGQFLNDTTGNRRFICIQVDEIDYMRKVDMDLVMAQALALYKEGFQYWFDRKEIDGLMSHNEEFVFAPVIDELLLIYYEPVAEELRKTRDQFMADNNIFMLTTTQIATRIGERSHVLINNGATVSLGKALKKHGFVRFKRQHVFVYLVRELADDVVQSRNRSMISDPGTNPVTASPSPAQ